MFDFIAVEEELSRSVMQRIEQSEPGSLPVLSVLLDFMNFGRHANPELVDEILEQAHQVYEVDHETTAARVPHQETWWESARLKTG